MALLKTSKYKSKMGKHIEYTDIYNIGRNHYVDFIKLLQIHINEQQLEMNERFEQTRIKGELSNEGCFVSCVILYNETPFTAIRR